MSKVKQNIWMSLSDLMTVLMVIFMFIAISYISQVQKAQKEKEKIVTDFQDTKIAIYKELKSAFEDKVEEWDVEIGRDLSIRFSNPQVLFASGRSDVTLGFKNILNDFLPVYFKILLQDKYKTKIKEIRIEGHTDDTPININGYDPYIGNVILSQGRSVAVLNFFRRTSFFQTLEKVKQTQLQYWITTNGLSYGRALDDNKQESFLSKNPINKAFSRRVEFRIITTSDELIDQIIKSAN